MADVDRGNIFEKIANELRSEAQKLSSPYARELATQMATMVTTIWNIDRGTTAQTSRTTEDEQRRNR